MTYEELKYPVRHSSFATDQGVEIDGVAYRSELLDSLGKLGWDKSLDVGFTSLVARLLKNLVDGEVDAAIYSQLSGVTHGTTSAVGMFVDNAPPRWRLIFPRDIALEYTGYIYSATVNVADRAAEIFSPPAAIVDRWNGARDRASIALSELRDSI